MKEKQIEEMRKDLIEIFDEEYEKHRMILPNFTAEKLIAKGYRKQSEGEWIWTENGDNEKSYIETKFCHNCGARTKGESDER